MTSIDTEHFREALLDERRRVEHALTTLRDEHPGSLDDEVEEVAAPDSEATSPRRPPATLGREIDYTLGENAEPGARGDRRGARSASRAGTYGTCVELRQGDPVRTAGGASLGFSLHRLQAQEPEGG